MGKSWAAGGWGILMNVNHDDSYGAFVFKVVLRSSN